MALFLVRSGPQRTTGILVLALAMIRSLATTITAPVLRMDAPIIDWVSIDVDVSRLVPSGGETVNGWIVGSDLPVWPSVVVRHQWLEPDGVASIVFILPVASESILDSFRLAPRISKSCTDREVEVCS